jgi:hypothetical protein
VADLKLFYRSYLCGDQGGSSQQHGQILGEGLHYEYDWLLLLSEGQQCKDYLSQIMSEATRWNKANDENESGI